MSLDQQVALARTTRGESTHLSKAARQIVPPFLQKLYEIVNDPKNSELIRWSENGDSFFVLNHERFAREVLGRWFKHQKFTSFVRQLNMYGFHKIPHLQQGVLRSDTDTEPWHFEHPHFHRGQPDLLCLIQRKKQPAHGGGDDPPIDFIDPVNNPTAPVGTLPPGQVLDVNSIVNGIAAIKRHQQAISADLSALKHSNDALWEEATLARRRHDKHQDTINRILKFLAGVFGHSAEPINKDDGPRTPNAVVPRPRQRLMIADRPKGKNVEVTEVQDDETDNHVLPQMHDSSTPFSLDQFATIESTDPSVNSPSVAPSEAFSPPADPLSHYSSLAPPTVRPSSIVSRNSDHGADNDISASNDPVSRHESSLSPATLASLSPNLSNSSNADNMLQAAFQQMLSSPGQMQRLMQALALQQNYPVVPPSDPTPATYSDPSSQLAPYDPFQNDYSRYRTDQPMETSDVHSSLPFISSPDIPSLEPLLDNTNRLDTSYRDASEIEADMDVLQSSINSLIQNLGIDPQTITTGTQNQDGLPHSTSGPPTSGIHNDLSGLSDSHDDTSSDMFLDALFKGISSGGGDSGMGYADITGHYDPSTQIDGTSVGDASTEQLTAFLDEVSDTNSPITHSPDLVPVNGRKRKSDVVDLSLPRESVIEYSPSGPKLKRKR
ncbi:hypothetical protein B0H21DRAFT_11869 [Amylocystis lapponica]|nr:hypothetical protein B0H21DRAFT_11869 [Amylocystis lapponica]